MRHRLLASSVITGAALALVCVPGELHAQSKIKVPNRAKLSDNVAKIVGGSLDTSDIRGREEIFLKVDELLAKDKKDVAIKTPAFWVEAIQTGYFKDRKSAAKKRVTETMMNVLYKNSRQGEVPFFYHGGTAYQSKNPAPLLVSILPEGTDAKEYLETVWLANADVKKHWIVAAVAESKEFPVSKEPLLAAYPFIALRDQFNTDANRWFLEGSGTACAAVQRSASQVFPDRLAGVILRDPKVAVTSANTSLYTTLIVHETPAAAEGEEPPAPAPDAEANKAAAEKVAKAYADLGDDEGRHTAVLDAPDDIAAIAAWVEAHPGRAVRSKYTYTTTLGEETGEPWSGSLMIVSPAKRGEPTNLTVEYDRAAGAVNITAENLGEFIVYMNDDLVDLDNPVSIVVNGEEIVSKKFERNFRDMFLTCDEKGEYGRVFPAAYRGFAPTVEAGDSGDGNGEGGDVKGGDPEKE